VKMPICREQNPRVEEGVCRGSYSQINLKLLIRYF